MTTNSLKYAWYAIMYFLEVYQSAPPSLDLNLYFKKFRNYFNFIVYLDQRFPTGGLRNTNGP